MRTKLRNCFQAFLTYYVCVSLIGCTTAAWRQADAYVDRESKYWSIDDVTFAAIRDQRFVRLCVKLQHFSEEAITEMEIDLHQIMGQFQGDDAVINSIEDGSKLERVFRDNSEDSSNYGESYATCARTLQKNEKILPIITKKTDGLDMSATLFEIGKEPPDHPSLFLIEHGDVRYITFGTPMNMYPDLIDHAFRCYAEDQKESKMYWLIPLAVVGDVFLVSALVISSVICIALLPICIIHMANRDHSRSLWPDNMELFYPLPSATLKPECD